MQVIGFCRFSYPAVGGFQVQHDDIATRRSYLYAPERMELRFRQFETFTLPSIAAQTDGDFTFVMLIDDALPAPYLGRLRDLVADVPQIELVARAPGPHRKVCQEVINSTRRDQSQEICLQFRHDDDDGLSLDYVETLRQAVRDVRPLLEKHRYIGIDHNRGFVARPGTDGICAEEQVTPYWGVALAMAVRPWVNQTIMNFSHARIAQFMPTLTFSDHPMYVRGHNPFNDSRQKKHVTPMDLPRLDPVGEDLFRSRFNICSNHVRDVFSAPPRFAVEGE